jgi:hypothetical protein
MLGEKRRFRKGLVEGKIGLGAIFAKWFGA